MLSTMFTATHFHGNNWRRMTAPIKARKATKGAFISPREMCSGQCHRRARTGRQSASSRSQLLGMALRHKVGRTNAPSLPRGTTPAKPSTA